jgi:hypothetical protein
MQKYVDLQKQIQIKQKKKIIQKVTYEVIFDGIESKPQLH